MSIRTNGDLDHLNYGSYDTVCHRLRLRGEGSDGNYIVCTAPHGEDAALGSPCITLKLSSITSNGLPDVNCARDLMVNCLRDLMVNCLSHLMAS